MAQPTTVPEVTPAANRHVANGSTLNFAYTFAIESPGDIVVMMGSTVQSYPSHYWLTGVGSTSGGEVQFTFYPPDGIEITILRAQDIQQLVNLLANSSYAPTTLLSMANRHTAVDQMLAERIARAPKFLPQSTQSDIPMPEPETDALLGWNSAAPWEVVNKSTSAIIGGAALLSNNTPARVWSEGSGGASVEISRSDHKHESQRQWFNVVDYGADPTGAADSFAAYELARTAALASGILQPVIYFPNGAYTISASMNFTGVRVQGESMYGTVIYNASSTTAVNGLFRADGTISLTTTISGVVTRGDRTITLADATGYVIGDLILIINIENAVQADTTNNSFSLITRIMDIAGSVLTLLDPIPFPIGASDTETVNKMTAFTGGVSDLTLNGNLNTGREPQGNNAIVAFYGVNVILRNIYTVNYQKGYGIFAWALSSSYIENHYSQNCGDTIGFGSALGTFNLSHCNIDNIIAHWPSRDGMTFNRNTYCNYSELVSVRAAVRNVKFHGCRSCVAVNIIGNNSQGGTGLTLSGGTSDSAFTNIVTIGNKGPNASGNQVGVWIADLTDQNNVLSNINSWDNGDWDITVFASDTGNVINGARFSTATKVLNQNRTPMFNIMLDDVLTGGLTSLGMVETTAMGVVGPSYRLLRHATGTGLIGQYVFAGSNNANAVTEYGKMYGSKNVDTAGAETGTINFQTITAGNYGTQLSIGNGIVVGVPTGGEKGFGTINASAVYDDNSILTDYVFDPQIEAPARFDAKFLDPEEYANFWKANKHLPSMPSRKEWEKERKSLGDLVQRLWETTELQAIHIEKLREEIKKK